MIKISSLSILENFSQKTWGFYDDRLVVKVKSLTFDYEEEVGFEKIKIIRNRKQKDLGWIWVIFIGFAILALVDLILKYLCLINSTILIIEQVIGVLFLLLLIPAFRTREFYSLLDTDKKYIATVEVNKKRKNDMLAAIQLIKQKTEIISEAYLTNPLPSISPIFQITEFDLPDFLNKARVFFYEDKLIALEKSLVEEVVTVIRYAEFSGKTRTAKTGNRNWDTVWSYWLLFVCITSFSLDVFFPELISGKAIYFWLFMGALLLIIPLFLLKYIKNEIMIFYDHKDNGIFWLEMNSSNREQINQIVALVQEKVVLNP
jgi:hypothetical protein